MWSLNLSSLWVLALWTSGCRAKNAMTSLEDNPRSTQMFLWKTLVKIWMMSVSVSWLKNLAKSKVWKSWQMNTISPRASALWALKLQKRHRRFVPFQNVWTMRCLTKFQAYPDAPATILSSIESMHALSNPFPAKLAILFSWLRNHCTVSLTIPLGDSVFLWCLFHVI